MVVVALVIAAATLGGVVSWSVVAGVFIVVASIFVIRLAIKETKKVKLFSVDRREPLRPVETDQEVRNKVLRQNFKPTLIPSELDAVVVGSGMGGLTTAALMALAGKRVLVLEQHDRAGGCTHAFVEKGYEFDVGIHYVGEMGISRKKRKHGMATASTRRLLDQITAGQLQWTPLKDAFDVVTIGDGVSSPIRRYPLPSGLDNLAAFLIEKFPSEKVGIEEFFRLCRRVDESMDNFAIAKTFPAWLATMLLKFRILPASTTLLEYFSTSLEAVVDSFVETPDLKAILCYCFGDYGVPPSRAPFAMQATLFTHFSNGAFYPVGGASEIAYHVIPTIERAGGKVLVRANVSEILTSGDGVVGVRVKRGKGQPDVDISAPLVVSNAGMKNTFESLLPASFLRRSTVADILPGLNAGLACFQLFVGLRGSAEELGVEPQNWWCFTRPDLDASVDEFMKLTRDEAMESDVPLMFVSFPSAKDPTWSSRFPPSDGVPKSTCAVVTLVNWDWFEKHDSDADAVVRGRNDDDYEQLKAALTERMWEQVTRWFPQLADKVDYMEGGTPLSHNYYIKATAGEIYGLDHDLKRFALEPLVKLRPDVGVPGLLMTGQDVFTCGFIGALYGGVVTAGAALGLGPRIFVQMDDIGKGWQKEKDD